MRTVSIVLLLVVASAPLPVHATVAESNHAFFLALAGWTDAPDTQALVMTNAGTETMPAADALRSLAERAGPVDLGALVAAAAPGQAVLGDLWLIAHAGGPCPTVTGAPSPLPFVPLHPQLWLYPGYIGTTAAPGSIGYATSWTTKTTSVVQDPTVVGLIDPYCVDFGTAHLLFLFANGVITGG